MNAFIPYGRQEIDDVDIAAVADALRKPLITQGPLVEEFEARFAEAVEAPFAVAFANGTAALHAAAVAAGLTTGDEVLTTPISFVASSNCALFTGARPRFADIDPDAGNLDSAAARAAGMTSGIRAAVPVSLAGLPADLEPLQEARRRGVVVIEDGCHAIGGRRSVEPVGAGGLADMTTFSLHPVKTITTGEGGVVSTRDEGLFDTLRSFRTHGMRRGASGGGHLKGPWHYDVEALGFNYRITDFQVAMGISQLKRLGEFVDRRNAVADRYHELLSDVPGLTLPARAGPGELHGYHLFVVRFQEGPRRRLVVSEGLLEAGIGTQLHYIPIPLHGLYRRLGFGEETMRHLPHAMAYYEQALSIPMFPGLRDGDVMRVAREIRRLMERPLPHVRS